MKKIILRGGTIILDTEKTKEYYAANAQAPDDSIEYRNFLELCKTLSPEERRIFEILEIPPERGVSLGMCPNVGNKSFDFWCDLFMYGLLYDAHGPKQYIESADDEIIVVEEQFAYQEAGQFGVFVGRMYLDFLYHKETWEEIVARDDKAWEEERRYREEGIEKTKDESELIRISVRADEADWYLKEKIPKEYIKMRRENKIYHLRGGIISKRRGVRNRQALKKELKEELGAMHVDYCFLPTFGKKYANRWRKAFGVPKITDEGAPVFMGYHMPLWRDRKSTRLNSSH